MTNRQQLLTASRVMLVSLLSAIVLDTTSFATESQCDFDSVTASTDHIRYLYDMQEYACALEELRIVLVDNSLPAQAKCEALLLQAAIYYDSLFNADARELRETVLTLGQDAFTAYPNWTEPYDNEDKGYEILMIEARQLAADESVQFSLVVTVNPPQNTFLAIDQSLWALNAEKMVGPGDHVVTISHPDYGKLTDTVSVYRNTGKYYDLTQLSDEWRISQEALIDSLQKIQKISDDSLRRIEIAESDRTLRFSVPNAPSGASMTLFLNGSPQACDCSPWAKFVVAPSLCQAQFIVSDSKGNGLLIDSVVFFPYTKEFRLKVDGNSGEIDFGRTAWKRFTVIDALVYLVPSSL